MVKPLVGLGKAPDPARRRESHGGADPRGLAIVHAGPAAQADRAARPDGEATQHQGFQRESDHCRPPAISPRERVKTTSWVSSRSTGMSRGVYTTYPGRRPL